MVRMTPGRIRERVMLSVPRWRSTRGDHGLHGATALVDVLRLSTAALLGTIAVVPAAGATGKGHSLPAYDTMLQRPSSDPGVSCFSSFRRIDVRRTIADASRFQHKHTACVLAEARADIAINTPGLNSHRDLTAPAAAQKVKLAARTSTGGAGAGDDPYAAVGIRAGAFLLKPAVEIRSGYDSNPARTPVRRGSPLVVVAPELQVKSEFDRHELNAEIRTSYVADPALPVLSHPTVEAKVAGRYDVSETTKIIGEARYRLDAENLAVPSAKGMQIIPVGMSSPGMTVGIQQKFGAVDLSVKALADHTVFQGSRPDNGTAKSNRDRNFGQYGAQSRISYALTPQFSPFVDVTIDRRIHDQSVDFNGLRRDSAGLSVSVGASLALPGWLAGELSVGHVMRNYADPLLLAVAGYFVDAALSYRPAKGTTILFATTSEIAETTVPGLSGTLQRDAIVQLAQQLDPQRTATFRAGYGRDQYFGSPRHDNRFFVSAGLTWKVSRMLQLNAELRQEWLHSNAPVVNNAATVATVGVRIQY